MKLQDNLVLFSFLSDQLGGDFDELLSVMEGVDEGRRPDQQSLFFSSFEQRESQLRLDLDQIAAYDLNVIDHEEAIGRRRSDFRLRYFQYLAALFTEIYLDRLSSNPAQLLTSLREHRESRFPHLPEYSPEDLRKLAFWMATGSGKTLVMHVGLRQFAAYKPFEAENVILLTPSPLLAEQHLDELLASGFDAIHALEAESTYTGIQVLEITKLYNEGAGMPAPKGGVSVPTSHFAGPNLVLVDEGHKGTGSKSELETEHRWRDIRKALAGQDGLTLEYSATFAQVTEGDDDLLHEYSRAILFEYAYKRFHEAGFGKDYWVINVKEDQQYGDTLLFGGLLSLYEQRRYFDDQRATLEPYLIEPPLMAFVGAHVTAGSEVVDVIRFLDRVQRDGPWALSTLQKVLTGKSGLERPNGSDAFEASFPYLKRRDLSPRTVLDDMRQRLFGGVAPLQLHRIQSADGEIGIRAKDAASDAYCGVINVGDALALLTKIRDETDVEVGEEDHMSVSLFDAIDQSASTLNFLIGSKKFIEGWSSWRVSVMGLLKVGRKAGAQVLQLFGRGVRLKGKDFSLRRASFVQGEPPMNIELLETLRIFGLSANYLGTFLETLRLEGAEDPVDRILPLHVAEKKIADARLRSFELESSYRFTRETIVFDPDGIEVRLDLTASVLVGGASGTETAKAKYEQTAIPEESLHLLSNEDLFQHALEYKRKKHWHNMYVTRESIDALVEKHSFVSAPPDVTRPETIDQLNALHRVACSAVERGLHIFYNREQRIAESDKLHAAALGTDHPNFPLIPVASGPAVEERAAYALKVAASAVEEVDKLLKDEQQRLTEDTSEPLPRLHADIHLYNPILVRGEAVSVPTGLVDSETRFVSDLRDYWKAHQADKEWEALQIYLLRNLPRKGVGFFQTAGFYPDFLLWLKKGKEQVLAFVEPKGLVRWPAEKVELLGHLGDLTAKVGFPVVGFMVSPTAIKDVQIGLPAMSSEEKAEKLHEQGVLFQDSDTYIQEILSRMKRLLTIQTPAKGGSGRLHANTPST